MDHSQTKARSSYLHTSLQLGVFFRVLPCFFGQQRQHIRRGKKFKENNSNTKAFHFSVTGSDIVFPVVSSVAAWGGVGHPGRLVLLLFRRAAGAQHGSTNQEQGSRTPPNVK